MNYSTEIPPILAEADSIIKNLFYSLAPLYKKDFPKGQDVTVPLFTALHSSSESILILLMNQAIFDADILLRHVMEGTVKYCYLLIGDEKCKAEKHNQYKITISEIDALTDHIKAVETIKILKKYSDNSTKPFEASILRDDVVSELKAKYPAKIRNEIKRRWSYQAILQELSEIYDEYKAQLGSLSTYALTSHYCHMDWTGVSSIQEQILSSPDGSNNLYDIGHALRIISNIVTFYLFRVIEYMRGNGWTSEETVTISQNAFGFIKRIDKKSNELIEAMH